MDNKVNFHLFENSNQESLNGNHLMKKSFKKNMSNTREYISIINEKQELNDKNINDSLNTNTELLLPKNKIEFNALSKAGIRDSVVNLMKESIVVNNDSHIKRPITRNIVNKKKSKQNKKNPFESNKLMRNHDAQLNPQVQLSNDQVINYQNYQQRLQYINNLQQQTPSLSQSIPYRPTQPQLTEKQMKQYIYNQQIREKMTKCKNEMLLYQRKHSQKQIEEDVINTPIFILQLKLDQTNKPKTFIIKRNDDLFISFKQYCTLHKIKDSLFHPLLIQIIIGMNKLFNLFNSSLTIENQIYFNQIKEFYFNSLYSGGKELYIYNGNINS